MKVIQKGNKTIICNFEPEQNGIYEIKFVTENGIKIYVGKTERTFQKRILEHINDCVKNKHCGSFQTVWSESTEIIITILERLDNCSEINYTKIETQWINRYGINNLVNDISSYAEFRKKYPWKNGSNKKKRN